MKEIVRIAGITVTILLVIVLLSFSDSEPSEPELSSSVEDALYGTNQTGDDNITNVLRDVMAVVRERNQTDFKNTTQLDKSDIYEVSSFETKADLLRIISLLELSISELKQAENSVLASYVEMEKLIRENPALTEPEIAEAIKSFNERRNDVETAAYRRERTETLIDVYEVSLEYYRFLYNQYDDYVIEPNENNERVLAFYTDANIEIANDYLSSIQQKSAIFQQADTSYSEYMNKRFADDGLDITTDDLYNAL